MTVFSKPTHDQALVLAAIFQSCDLVYQLAHNGHAENSRMEFSMSTLLNQDPASLSDLYGSTDNLRVGATIMETFFASPKQQTGSSDSREVINYVMSTIHLASKLGKKATTLQTISQGIERANNQAAHFSITHDNVYSSIADLYQNTISKMRLRIQVSGSGVYLQQNAIAARIRCMLFAAIRNAFLWRQLGGKRRHLLLQRERLVEKLNTAQIK